MTNLYSMLETNTDETKNLERRLERTEILFDLQGESYKISDTKLDKNIICVCGSCDLVLENNDKKDVITINHPSVTIRVEQDTNIELRNYTSATKIVIEYLGDINE